MISTILSGLMSAGFGSLVNSIIGWVANSVIYMIGQFLNLVNNQTAPDIYSQNFSHYLKLMEITSASLMLPLIMFAIIKLVITQNSQGLLKLIGVDIPISLLGTGFAMVMIKFALELVDRLSAMFLESAGISLSQGLSNLGAYLLSVSTPGSNLLPGFFTLVILLIFIFGFLGLVFEMIVRSAAIELAVLFLPLAFMGLIWPSTSHWLRKMIDLLISLIISKLIVVVVIALAVSQLTSVHNVTVGSVLTALALLLLAVYSPFFLMHIIPAMEYFGSVSQMGHSAKANITQKASKLTQAVSGVAGMDSTAFALSEQTGGVNSVIDSNLSAASTSTSTNGATLDTHFPSSNFESLNFYDPAEREIDLELFNSAYEDILTMRKAAGLDATDSQK